MKKSNRLKSEVRWKVARAVVKGPSHVKDGTECQDAASVETDKDVLSVCVCDGAGSARLSHVGATSVAREVSRFLASQHRQVVKGKVSTKEIYDVSNRAIASAIEEYGGESRDYACTLIALLLAGDNAVTFHLGDGLVAIVEAGSPKVLSPPQSGEFINQTTFVTSPRALSLIRKSEVKVGPLVTSFMLMTDGPERSLYHRQSGTVSQVVEQMASWLDHSPPEEVNRGLEGAIKEHFFSRTDDDCTVVIIRRDSTLDKFVCPTCKRWDLRRSSRVTKRFGRSRFRIKCAACGDITEFKSHNKREYPRDVREWVKHLVDNLNIDAAHLPAVTGIHNSTLRRWIKGYVQNRHRSKEKKRPESLSARGSRH